MGIEYFHTFLISAVVFTLTPGVDSIFVLNKSAGYGPKAGLAVSGGIFTGNIFQTLLAAFGLSLVIARSPLLFSIIKYSGAAYMAWLGIEALREVYRQGRLKSGGSDENGNRYTAKKGDRTTVRKTSQNSDTGISNRKIIAEAGNLNDAEITGSIFATTANPNASCKSSRQNETKYSESSKTSNKSGEPRQGDRMPLSYHFRTGLVTNLLNPKIPLFFAAFVPQFISPTHMGEPLPYIVLCSVINILGAVWFVILSLFAGSFAGRLMTSPTASRILKTVTGCVFLILALAIAVLYRQ